MFKLTTFLLSLLGFTSAIYMQGKPSKIGSAQSDIAGKSKIVNPEAETPFPYSHTVDKGLTDNSGNIWFGTSEGIYRYNGKVFTQYPVMDGLYVDHSHTMLQTKAGVIWFGAHFGIIRCHPLSTGSPSFTAVKIQTPNSSGFMAEVKDNHAADARNTVTQMMEDHNGVIWFCLGYNIYRSNGDSKVAITTAVGDFLKSEKTQYHCKYPDDFGICGMYQDKQGNILISTSACSCGPNVTYSLAANRVNNACILNCCKHDLHNAKQLAAHNKEIASSFTKIVNEDGNSNIAFTTALEDKAGNIWIGSDSGVYQYNGTSFTHFTKNGLLRNSVVNNIYEDKTGNIWFGTGESSNLGGNGVFRYQPSVSIASGTPVITQFTGKDGLFNNGPFKSNVVSGIAEDNTGKLWISGDGGACYYNGGGFTSFTKKDGFTRQPVKCIVKDKAGNLWFGTWQLGLYCYDGKSLTCFTENEPGL